MDVGGVSLGVNSTLTQECKLGCGRSMDVGLNTCVWTLHGCTCRPDPCAPKLGCERSMDVPAVQGPTLACAPKGQGRQQTLASAQGTRRAALLTRLFSLLSRLLIWLSVRCKSKPVRLGGRTQLHQWDACGPPNLRLRGGGGAEKQGLSRRHRLAHAAIPTASASLPSRRSSSGGSSGPNHPVAPKSHSSFSRALCPRRLRMSGMPGRLPAG
eukprot:366037-Chlamydomonas_euryale.AAC.6